MIRNLVYLGFVLFIVIWVGLLYFVFVQSDGTKSLTQLEQNIAVNVYSKFTHSKSTTLPLAVRSAQAEEAEEEEAPELAAAAAEEEQPAGAALSAQAEADQRLKRLVKPRERKARDPNAVRAGSVKGLNLASQHARYGDQETFVAPAPMAEIERNLTFYLHTLHTRLRALAGPHVDAVDVWEVSRASAALR